MAHQIFRRVGLVEAALVHDRDAVRQRDPVGQVVGDIKCRQAVLLVKSHDLLAHPQAIGRIDIAQRFVHQHDARRGDHGSAESDPLLLSARELGGFAFEEAFFDADLPGQRPEKLRDLIARPFSHLERQA